MEYSSRQDYDDDDDDVRPGQENIFPAVQLQRLHVLHRLSGNLESPGNVIDDQPFCPCSMPSHLDNVTLNTGTVVLSNAAYMASPVLALQDRLVVLRHGAPNQELRGDRQEGSQRGSLVVCFT